MAKQLKCKPGNYQCGGRCQSNSLKCRANGSPEASASLNDLVKVIESGKANSGKAVAKPEQEAEQDTIVTDKKEASAELTKIASKGKASALGGKANELALVQEFEQLAGKKPSQDIADELDATRKELGNDVTNERIRQARDMAAKSMEWARQNGYEGAISDVVWTARPGSMEKAGITGTDGKPIVQSKHPADVVVLFEDGKQLGISAKSTLGKDDITFKNRGAGTLGAELGTDILKTTAEKASAGFAQANGLGGLKGKKLKQAIRANEELVAKANAERPLVLNEMRSQLLNTLDKVPAEQRADTMRSLFLDTDDQGLRYIKATGTSGDARISDPTKNKVLDNLSDIQFSTKGNDTIQVTGKGGTNLFTIRAKYESQAMASGIKFDVK